MYANKINEKLLSPIRKKVSPISESYERKDTPENMSWYGFDRVSEGNTLDKALQLRASSFYNMDIIQLRYDGQFKIKSGSDECGYDPTKPQGSIANPNPAISSAPTIKTSLGLTAHHVIPDSILEQFFKICENYANGSPIKNAFNEWKSQAIKSANATNSCRNNYAVDDPATADTEDSMSACKWMCGNLFIGPESRYRIDDAEDTFDYGAYKYIEDNVNDPESEVRKNDNKKISKSKMVYDDIIEIIEKHKANKLSINNDEKKIIAILQGLTEIAKEQVLLRQNGFNSQEPAYDLKEWVSVGTQQIYGMKSEHDNFIAILNYYQSIPKKFKNINARNNEKAKETSAQYFQKTFCKIFEKHIKKEKRSDTEKLMGTWVMSKYVFDYLTTAKSLLEQKKE